VGADESEVVLICLEEACANAIVHGRPTEDIEVSVRVEGSTLALRVRDQGHGAVVEELLPITMPNPLSPGGRGLPLIKALMDELELTECDPGLEVTMTKRTDRRQGHGRPHAA
jgi:anti-sigma regulatory factor (Ser/Thr protein kinase)